MKQPRHSDPIRQYPIREPPPHLLKTDVSTVDQTPSKKGGGDARLQLLGEMIKQVMIFKKSGVCLLNLDYWSTRLDEDLFSNFLSAIISFSAEALGLELCELTTQEHHMFLSRSEDLIIAVVAEESVCEDPETKTSIHSLIKRIRQILESIDHSWSHKDLKVPEWLQKRIKREIALSIPTPWSPFASDEQFLSDVVKIRILTHLSDQKKHTIEEIGIQLHLGRPILIEKLAALDQEGFITTEQIPFGWKTYIKYAISEMGKLTLDNLENTFPGLWF